MEGLEHWLRTAGCNAVVVLKDGGQQQWDLPGIEAIVVDPERGFDAVFALATYHPANVLAVEPDEETCTAIWDSTSVQKFFCVAAEPPASVPEGWTAHPSAQGILYEKA